MADQITFDEALSARDKGMEQVAINAEEHFPSFAALAEVFVLAYLKEHGPSKGEDITFACRSAGIVPHDDRAFGPVYMRLSRRKQIVKAGTCVRKRGHGTSGGNIWALLATEQIEGN